ncbi:uncharacterized protein C8R40DRAFT_1070377 [Lentinula edodes]|uniref:uncharacterized protein n=1 Tax=Lentinula edodes TaxID=5353 RepID=UPI001E8D43C8|nr:uncharacterized protein C8R40DRAFT_1070377 [Lentinula edodes]KAH7874234.1 hypothetical protein C8R40DRAFT_1070377 [Lentinula edodes]
MAEHSPMKSPTPSMQIPPIPEHAPNRRENHIGVWKSLRAIMFSSLSLLALVPLEGLVEYGGEQMSLYCGKDLGDLIVIMLSNSVEASLAFVLFTKCELRLLQSTLIGVTLLHLLLVPGVTFIIGGAKLVYQELNPHIAQLNHTLLITGFVNNRYSQEEKDLLVKEPEVNLWVCILLLVVTIGFIAPTTQFLADSVDIVRAEGRIPEEWFGVLLPLATYSADGLLAIGRFLRCIVRHFRGQPAQPLILAKARSIHMAIQFNLFWVPSLIITDQFEVMILVGACFLVSYVTADAKTNWAEGATMVSFYVMIALTAWFYVSDREISQLLVGGNCQAPSDSS